MTSRIVGKVAIVTGAAQGIGAEIAQVFASEGANLVLFDTQIDQLEMLRLGIEKKWSNRVLIYKVDISDSDKILEAVNEVVAFFGQIDILVNNAGVNFSKPFNLVHKNVDKSGFYIG